ncbi:hypothetical protein ANCCAN_04911 [Ancylostoma caninum]|uniref:Uncharacterized protein n=1 Tax=Ancylostoma caninum TaxID=29170 RepID=A0A368GXI1_ANCCA|nr:hypothetical protein ANCCAN_04911 [Ancylostoma caninum]
MPRPSFCCYVLQARSGIEGRRAAKSAVSKRAQCFY